MTEVGWEEARWPKERGIDGRKRGVEESCQAYDTSAVSPTSPYGLIPSFQFQVPYNTTWEITRMIHGSVLGS